MPWLAVKASLWLLCWNRLWGGIVGQGWSRETSLDITALFQVKDGGGFYMVVTVELVKGVGFWV